MNTFIVRTAMADLSAHRLHERSLGWSVETNKPCDTAHRNSRTGEYSFEFIIAGPQVRTPPLAGRAGL